MKTIQINETDYVNYYVEDKRKIVAEAWIGEKYLGQMNFNMKVDIPEDELEAFSMREAMNLHNHMKSEFQKNHGR